MNDHPYIDAIVHNEGEIVFTNLLKNDDWSTVNGITTHSFQTPLEKRIKNISEMPSPYLNGLFDNLISIYYLSQLKKENPPRSHFGSLTLIAIVPEYLKTVKQESKSFNPELRQFFIVTSLEIFSNLFL